MNIIKFTFLSVCLFFNLFTLSIFILTKETSELLIVLELLFFHWNNLSYVRFEIFKVFHEFILIFDKSSDLIIVYLELALSGVILWKLDVSLVILKDLIGIGSG